MDGRPASPDDRAWAWIVAGVVFVVLSALTATLARSAAGGWLTLLVVVQVLASGLAFLVPQLRSARAARLEATAEEREIEARVDTKMAMNDALDPILRLLGHLALEREVILRDQLRAQAVVLVLKTAAEFIGPDRARACWFRLEPGPPKRLEPSDFAGRAGSPSTTFVEGTPAGDAAIGMVLDDRDLLCADTESDPPPDWDISKVRDYRTFVSVSVIAGDTGYGMLTLDALEPGDLVADDLALLRLMAEVLAVALSIS